MKNVICITGSSGVGKSTLSKFLYFIFGCNDVVTLNGDDAHRWERGDTNWEIYTHLNPSANNLDKELENLKNLSSGESITREKYNHDTGKFDAPMDIDPKEVIVYEGLHALYGAISELCDIGIFVETERDLLTQWKVERDTTKRGYTIDQVKAAIKRREIDESLYIEPQKENADIIIRFEEKRDGRVHLDLVCQSVEHIVLANRIKSLYDRHRDFLTLCEKTSFEYELVQTQGGNISYKFEDKIVITSSGKDLGDVTLLDGFSVCDDQGVLLDKSQGRPSMETGFHLKIPHTFVLHTHPIHLNTILCCVEAKEIISSILSNYDYTYIDYYTPGDDLKNNFKVSSDIKIYLLESHGLVCSGDSFKEIFDTTMEINELCKQWLFNNSKAFKKLYNQDRRGKFNFLFPDAVVLEEKMKSINDFMLKLHKEVGLKSNFLSESEIHKLLNMKEEKYRKSLQ